MSEVVRDSLTEPLNEVSKESSSILSKVTVRDVLVFGVGFSVGWAFKHFRNKYLEMKRKWLLRSLEKTNEGLGKSGKDTTT
ncbi:Oidioi.mRNA.OKI2018_I69.chr1.g1042.t1.cds [Oikopleura dioica]|uniref:Oidioi.mRNA.OKI2018_I69.chr1.g1042.t1.cds n=1 Tax=Oikopleura dioica TaxID=34765 RepID=A0ABN7SNG8_OIKDI|nr:Oidioi.mRNA.OKI2018_I69.chr1.g1042.t1.cds [Oikopleura dioica]